MYFIFILTAPCQLNHQRNTHFEYIANDSADGVSKNKTRCVIISHFNGIRVQCAEQIGTFHAFCWQVVQYNSSFPAFTRVWRACLFELHLRCHFDGQIRLNAPLISGCCFDLFWTCCDARMKCGRSGAAEAQTNAEFCGFASRFIMRARWHYSMWSDAAFCPTSWKRERRKKW